MSGGSRKSAGSAASTPDHRKRLITLSVIGLSGSEAQKGCTGVGKSVFCNRLVRPHFNDFFREHISSMSQTDFCSPVVNQTNWLYWGDVSLDSTDYTGPTQQIRVIEHTVFLDDISFEPLGGRTNDYLQRATKVEFESRNKLMYISPDQLGQEEDFYCCKLDTSYCKVDAFAVLFDVSHVNGRSLVYQSAEVVQLLNAAFKTKLPVFLLATKCDHPEVAAVQEFQKLAQRKDLQKHPNFYWAETSALDNVNCANFLYELAKVVDKRAKPKIPPFVEAQLVRRHYVNQVKADFKQLLHTILPREEYPMRHGNMSWKTLLEDFSVNTYPAFTAFVAEFGAIAANQFYDDHVCLAREWWINRELNANLPALNEVLRRLFNRSFLCKTSWEQLCVELKAHPQYDNYFRPFGRSLDKYSQNYDYDQRMPAELLQKVEARQQFQTFQRQLLDEIALERQSNNFRRLLDQKEAVTPGRSFSDLKVMCPEVVDFERALPSDYAQWVYDNYQKDLKAKAIHDFNELLLESIGLFVDLVVEWRIKQANDPNRISSLTEREYNILCSCLIEDKRYRDMSGLSSERKDMISKLAAFISMPLTCFCLAEERCSDLVIAAVVSDIRETANKFCTIEAEVYGDEQLVDELISAVKLVLTSDKLFHHNDKTAKINCHRADSTQHHKRSSRVRSPVCLLDSAGTATNLLNQSDSLFITGPTPIFVSTCSQNSVESSNVQRLGRQLADRFNAVFIGMNNNAYGANPIIQNPNLPAHFSQQQVEQILHEICIGQMGTNYADMRIRISFLCDDPFSISQVLSPLLEHTVQMDDSGGCFCVDVGLPEEQMNVRVCNYTGSYHHWLMSKWLLNSFNGHILIYSPCRLASWRHAELAIQLLLDAATVAGSSSSNVLERQCMGQSILLLAVEDPSNFFTDKESSQLLSEGARLAERVGCRFMAISQSMTHAAQFQLYLEFFAQLLHNQPLPNVPYTVCAHNSNFATKRRPTYFSGNATTFTGSASTLLSSSSASHESNLSASCAPEPHSSTVATYNPESKSRHSTREHSRQRKSIDSSRNGKPGVLNIVDSQVPTTSQPTHLVQEPNGQLPHPRRDRSSSRHSTFVEPNKTVPSVESKTSEMSNRLRRPLSAIGSFMSGGLSATENSPSHESSSNSIAPIETHSNKIKFSPSGFRKLFQRSTAGSESSAASTDEQARKKLHRSSTVDANSVVVGGQNPSVRINGRPPEVVPASPQNSYTSYVHISDDVSPPPKTASKRPLRTVLKSLSVDSEDAGSESPVPPNAVRFAPDSENIPQRTDMIANKMDENYERPSRLRRFADRFTRKNRHNGPRRRQSLPPKRLASTTTSSPTSGSSDSPVDITYESECQNGDEIPTFARQCVQYIEKNGGLILEGLYRLSGHPGFIGELERQYRKTGSLCVEKLIDDTRGSKETALIAVSAAFKRYLQSFNEPLIPTKLNDELLELISDRIDIDDQSPLATRSVDSIRRLFERSLPRVNARLLAFICAHLERVAINCERNKMTVKNLALIWAGTLFRLPPSTPIADATERMVKFPILTFFFIKHYSIFFCNL